MNRHTFLARISLLFASILGSINVASGSWLITDGEAGKVSASEKISSDSTKAVCYIKETGVYYTSLDRALEVAYKNGKDDTIYVIPGLKDSNGKLEPVNITGTNRYLEKGDTLNLPYDGETFFNEDEHGTELFADGSSDLVSEYRKAQVVLATNAKLTIYGTLNIGGVLSRPSAGVSGQTTGNYCEITMDNTSQLICSGGTINCYGYIKRTSNDNGAKLTITDKGTLLSPFVIYDYKAGNVTLATINLPDEQKYCPFQIFDFCNIQTNTFVYSGSSWIARTCIYIDMVKAYEPSEETDKQVHFIGPTSEKTAFVLTQGYVRVDYKPSDPLYTEYSTTSAKTQIDICGTASLGGIALTIQKAYSIDTTKFFFPISYRLSVKVMEGSTLNLPSKIKLLNGAKLIVDSGATLNVDSYLAVYDESTSEKTGYVNFVEITTTNNSSQPSYPSPYPTGMGNAEFINNGTVNVNYGGALGGYVSSTSASAVINYLSKTFSFSSYEYGGTIPDGGDTVKGGSVTAKAYTLKPMATISDGNSSYSDSTLLCNVFTSNSYGEASESKIGWKYNPENTVAIDIQTNEDKQNPTYGYVTLEAILNRETTEKMTYDWKLLDPTSGNELSDTNITTVTSSNGKILTIQNKAETACDIQVVLTTTNSLPSSVTVKKTLTVQSKQTLPDAVIGFHYKIQSYSITYESSDEMQSTQPEIDDKTISNLVKEDTTYKGTDKILNTQRTTGDVNLIETYYKIDISFVVDSSGNTRKDEDRSDIIVNWVFPYQAGAKYYCNYLVNDEYSGFGNPITADTKKSDSIFTIVFAVRNGLATALKNVYIEPKLNITYWNYIDGQKSINYPKSSSSYLKFKLYL